jgi:hypothetical protein
MKITLNTYQIADELKRDTNARWSYNGSLALAEYLEQYQADNGEEMELDLCSIRGEFSEYGSPLEAALEYDWRHEASILDDDDNLRDHDDVEEEDNQKALEWLKGRTQVIEFEGGIIVSSF